MAGRKSLKEELRMFERYSELTEPYFRVLKKKLESDTDPSAQMWAVEQLTKAFVKMIPQDLTTKGDKITPAVIKIIAPDGTDVPALTQTIPSMAEADGQADH